MSEDRVQVKIEADTGDFTNALKDAISQLTDSISQMKNSFADLADNIKNSMMKASDSTNQVAKNMTEGMKNSAGQITTATNDAAKNLTNGLQSSMNQAVTTVITATDGMAGNIVQSMQTASTATTQATNNMASTVKQNANDMTNSFSKVKSIIGSIGIGIVGVFGQAAKSTIDYEKSLVALSRTTGLNIENASKLAYVGSQYGMATEDLSRNVGILSRNLGVFSKDSDNASNVFNRFNIAVQDSENKMLPANEILMNIADRFKSMPNGIQKTALSMELFGRSGQSMIPILNQGRKGIEKLGLDAEKLGLVFKDVAALQAYNEANKKWNATLKGLQLQLGTAVLPALTAFSKAITGVLKAFNQLDPAFKTTIITTASVAGSVAALTLGWGAAAAAITAFGGPFSRVGTMMQAMPNLATSAANGVKNLVVGMTNATIAMVKYVATGGLFTTATNAMKAISTITSVAMHTLRTAVMATSLAFSTGGIKSIVSYGASLVTMNGIAKVARVGLMLLYGTVTAGIAVVVALATAWTANFGGIQEATADTCDGIIYGLNNFADGVSQICSGIGQIFVSLAKTIGNALVGDFSGAIEEAKGLLDGIKNVGVGAFGAMQGIGQAIYGAASDPEGAMRFGSAAWDALKTGTSDIFGFGDSGAVAGGMEDIPNFDGAGSSDDGKAKEKGAAEKDEESAYEKAKKLYQQQIQLAEYSAAEKEKIYLTYLESIEKSDNEMVDYRIGLYQLDKEAFQDSLHEREIELENSKLEEKVTEKKYLEDLATIKKQSLDAEVDFRAKAMMEAMQLTESEKTMQISAYKEKSKATLWYKESLKEVLSAEKNLADYQKSIVSKLADYRQEMALSAIEIEENRINIAYEQNKISENELYTLQEYFENKRYELQKENLEKKLYDTAINLELMKALYKDYSEAVSESEKEAIMNKMGDNTTDASGLISTLAAIESAYASHYNKIAELQNKIYQNEKKNINEVKSSLTNSISQAFQDIAHKSTTLAESIKNIWSSMMNTILKQFADFHANQFTNKAFNKLLGNKEDKPNKIGLKSEQENQDDKNTILSNAINQRLSMQSVAAQQEVAITESKAAAETAIETTKDQTITFSAQAMGKAAVQSIGASLQAMLAMLPTLLLMSAITGLFGGGKTRTSESTGPGINLGRNPDSYYKTPSFSVPSFDVGSWNLPSDTLAMVHQGEMIVPAKGGLADNMRSMLTNSGKMVQQNPNIQLSYSAAHYGRTNKDVQLEMKQNAKYIVKMINTEWRNFNRGKM